MKIAIIGNGTKNNDFKQLSDGGRIKVALYVEMLRKEGHDVFLIDLDNWTKRPFKIVDQIRNHVKRSDVILIMGGPKGSRIIIPIVNFFNRNKRKRIVFSPLGIGTLDKLLRGKSEQEVNDFIRCVDFQKIKDKKMRKELRKLDLILPQTKVLTNAYQQFYEISNCVTLTNFRFMDDSDLRFPSCDLIEGEPLKIIFVSRVKEDKGILDLAQCVAELNEKYKKIIFSLDIYGEMQLEKDNEDYLLSLKNKGVSYNGVLLKTEVIGTIKKYLMFSLPTRYYGEGTPGALVESLIAGVPVLVSSYSQVNALIQDNENGIIYEIGNKEDLKNKLLYIYKNPEKIIAMRKAAFESGKKFLYSGNRELFLSSILGDQNK